MDIHISSAAVSYTPPIAWLSSVRYTGTHSASPPSSLLTSLNSLLVFCLNEICTSTEGTASLAVFSAGSGFCVCFVCFFHLLYPFLSLLFQWKYFMSYFMPSDRIQTQKWKSLSYMHNLWKRKCIDRERE